MGWRSVYNAVMFDRRTRRDLKWIALILFLLLAALYWAAGWVRVQDHGSPRPPSTWSEPGCFGIPGWFVLVIVAVPAALLWWVDRHPDPLPGHCRKCGYDLTGNVSGRCPECGERVRDEEKPGDPPPASP
jgi:hypothetical protein